MNEARREWIESLEEGDEVKIIKEVHTRYQDNPQPGEVVTISKLKDAEECGDGSVSREIFSFWMGYEDGARFEAATHADPVEPDHPGTKVGRERSQWLESLEVGDPVWQVNHREGGEKMARRVRRVSSSTITLDLYGSAHTRQTGECFDFLTIEPVDDLDLWRDEWTRIQRTQALKDFKWGELTDGQRDVVIDLLDGFDGVELDIETID